ncbi:MAG TPA: M10 family metallopeptidase, partial [Allosphingosinicella sp.]
MATATPTTRSFNPGIDGLLGDYQWVRGVPLDYGFPTVGAWTGYSQGEEPYLDFAPITAAQQAAVLRAFAQIESFTNLDFVLTSGAPEQATMRFGRTSETDGAHAYLPFNHPAAGDVWFAGDGTYDNPAVGDYADSTHLHEIGHALGLKHPHDDETFGVMPLQYDNMNYTVMTYRSYEGMPVEAPFHNGEFGFNQTYMMYDIAALQHLYGADFGPESRNGDSHYVWTPGSGNMTINGVIEHAPGANVIFLTVWDGGGIDTYDFSAYLTGLVVRLNPGEWTTTSNSQWANLGDGHFAMGNIANALLYQGDARSLIENAIGGAGDDVIWGNQGANTLTGNGGNDLINGLGGGDTMIGGAGDDRFFADDPGDSVVEAADGGFDKIEVTASSFTLGANVEEMIGGSLTGPQQLTGGPTANVIRPNDFNGNVVSGGGGNDNIRAGFGASTLRGDAGDDSIGGSDLVDIIEGGDGNDNVDAAGGNDWIDGGADQDALWGQGGNDRILGGAGDDDLRGGHDSDTIDGGDGNDRIRGGRDGDTLEGGAGDDHLSSDIGVEDIDPQYAPGLDTLIGGPGADILEADLGEDLIVFRAMADSTSSSRDRILRFESGVDKIDLSDLPGGSLSWVEQTDPSDNSLYSLVTFTAQGGTLTFRVDAKVVLADFIMPISAVIQGTEGNDQLSGSDLSDEIFGNGGHDLLRGFANDDLLDGGAGNDRLEGGLGADAMIGGTGDDVFNVDDVGDSVSEAAGGGLDMVETSIGFTLGAEIEMLILTGSAPIAGTGNGLANTMQGNGAANSLSGADGDDWLDGGLGADSMSGGLGNDLFFVENAGDLAIELAGEGNDEVRTTLSSYVLADNVEKLTGISGGNQSLTGNALGNIVTGGAGADRLDGAGGADQMIGGLGSDIYVVDNGGDTIVEASGAGTDTVESSISYVLGDNLERLTLTGSGSVYATGNGLGNVIFGNSGSNLLDGGAGIDLLAGLEGDDVYILSEAGDQVNEQPGAGADSVRAGFDYTLGDWVENLVMLGGAVSGTGNGLANNITGNGFDNVIDGKGGADAMTGGIGDDTYFVDDSGDQVIEGSGTGTDTIQSSVTLTLGDNVEHLVLLAGALNGTGNGLANAITGNGANNMLNGMGGADILSGGLG